MRTGWNYAVIASPVKEELRYLKREQMKRCEREKWLNTPRGEFKSQPAGGRPMSLIPGTFCRHRRLKQSPSDWQIISFVISRWLVLKGRQSVSSWEQSCLLRFFFFLKLWVVGCSSSLPWYFSLHFSNFTKSSPNASVQNHIHNSTHLLTHWM